MTIHRRSLRFLDRNRRWRKPHVTPTTSLLPREIFNDFPEVQAAYDRQLELNTALRDHTAKASQEHEAAKQAQSAYEAEVREALATGQDPDKVKNASAEHATKAGAHEELATQARREAVAHGYVIGQLLADHAEDVWGPVEADIKQAASRARASVDELRDSFADLAEAWHVRRILSSAALYGGAIDSHRAATHPPAAISQALAAVNDSLHDLDELRADEADLIAWREQEARATRANEGAWGVQASAARGSA